MCLNIGKVIIMLPVFIWDLDGTLLDSYGIIVNSLYETYLEKGVVLDKETIHREIIRTSVSDFIMKLEKEYGIPFDALKDRYSLLSRQEKLNIKAMKHAYEILKYLNDKGIDNYVYTHRGVSTKDVLQNIGIEGFFKDIINSQSGFPRKPDPTALNHLVDKYHLDKNNTYYVGDRPIDIECANNAGVKSILLLPEGGVGEATGKEDIVIKDLLDIKNII